MSLEDLPNIRVLGPREIRSVDRSVQVIDTTSQAGNVWTTGLSPFKLGPCELYDGRTAKIMENAWQACKVYAKHLSSSGEPSPEYFKWAESVWSSNFPQRYPMGKGARPEFSFWDGEKLSYVEARQQIYWPLYRDAVAKSPAFEKLKEVVSKLGSDDELVLFDFDGFDHDAMKMSLKDVMLQDRRPMGHGFVLKAMLQLGVDVTPQNVIDAADDVAPRAPKSRQFGLF